MFLHPFTAILMLFWLSLAGRVAWHALESQEVSSPSSLAPLGMFIWGVVFTLGGFFPEAIKAKRLLMAELGGPRVV
jgi:hypothetical protein